MRGKLQAQCGQATGQGLRVPGQGDSKVITGAFAVIINPVRDVMYGRVVEEHGFDGGLHQIDQEVVTPNMGDFMQQDGFNLFLWQTGEKAGRYKDDRFEETQRQWA